MKHGKKKKRLKEVRMADSAEEEKGGRSNAREENVISKSTRKRRVDGKKVKEWLG